MYLPGHMVEQCDWLQVGLICVCVCVCVSAVNIGNSQEWNLSRSIPELRLVSDTTFSPTRPNIVIALYIF